MGEVSGGTLHCNKCGSYKSSNETCMLPFLSNLDIREVFNHYISSSRGRPLADRLNIFLDVLSILHESDTSCKCQSKDIYRCEICQGFMISPVTLSCGHTFMKACLDTSTPIWKCPKCQRNYSREQLLQLKANVIISTLQEKWWPLQKQAGKAHCEGDELFQKGNSLEAIKKFNLSLELDPSNHLAAFSRSIAFFSIGDKRAALCDAELAVKLHPVWGKAYLHRGIVLVSLEKYELAFVSFVRSYILSQNSEKTKDEVKQLISELITSSSLVCCRPQLSPLPSSNLPSNVLEQQKRLTGSQGSLGSNDSLDSLWASGGNDSEEDDPLVWSDAENKRVLCNETSPYHLSFKLVKEVVRSNKGQKFKQFVIDPDLVHRPDFECPLCMRLLLKPITTPCGHTFCCNCLDRCFDHQPNCPLCKTHLAYFLAERNQYVTEFIDSIIKTLLPGDYAERKRVYDEEMEEFANAGKDLEHVVPLFICTVAFPTVPCPLHIFEPRYRLMIRQCVESGANRFGMCAYVRDHVDGIASIGTMLKIRSVQYLPDGRSVVDTIGNRRFRIRTEGMRDGYHTGAVEFLHDEPLHEKSSKATMAVYKRTWEGADLWFRNLPNEMRETILKHFGPMPSFEENYSSSPDGPAWLWWAFAVLPLDRKVQLQVLGMTSLHVRLDTLRKVFLHMQETDLHEYSL